MFQGFLMSSGASNIVIEFVLGSKFGVMWW